MTDPTTTTNDDDRTGRLDAPLSRQVAALIGAQVQQCYRNSIMALATVDLPALAGAQYVEGWVLRDGLPIPIEHGWLELPSGRVVDTTLVLLADDARLTEERYVAAVRYTRAQALQLAVVQESRFPLLLAAGYGVLSTDAYQAAYNRVMRLAMGPDWDEYQTTRRQPECDYDPE